MRSVAWNSTYVGRRQIRLLFRWAQGYHARSQPAGSGYSLPHVSEATQGAQACLGCRGGCPIPGRHFEKGLCVCDVNAEGIPPMDVLSALRKRVGGLGKPSSKPSGNDAPKNRSAPR